MPSRPSEQLDAWHSTSHRAIWRIMTNLRESSATAVTSSDCTECLERVQNILRCLRPHLKCSEPSLTPEQARVWQAVRHLPGVRLRVIRGNSSWWKARRVNDFIRRSPWHQLYWQWERVCWGQQWITLPYYAPETKPTEVQMCIFQPNQRRRKIAV